MCRGGRITAHFYTLMLKNSDTMRVVHVGGNWMQIDPNILSIPALLYHYNIIRGSIDLI